MRLCGLPFLYYVLRALLGRQSYTSQVLQTFKKGAHQSHMGRQKMGWFLADYLLCKTEICTEGSCLTRISLLRFFKKVHKFALCEFMPYAWVILFHYCNFFLAIFAQFG